jgi:hypothetical protein
VAPFCNPASGGTFSSTAIEIIKWVKKFAVAVAQAKVTHILRPGKASEKTPKGVIPPSLYFSARNEYCAFHGTSNFAISFIYSNNTLTFILCGSNHETVEKWQHMIGDRKHALPSRCGGTFSFVTANF